MGSDKKRMWSARITRKTSGTIDVEVEASSKEEAESIVKDKLRDGEYDQAILNEFSFNAEFEEDDVVVEPKVSRFSEGDSKSFEMFKDVVPEDEFNHITGSMQAGEELHYALILANVYKLGLQKLEFTLKKQ